MFVEQMILRRALKLLGRLGALEVAWTVWTNLWKPSVIESPNGIIRSSMPGATSVRLVRVALGVEPAPAEVSY